MTNEVTPPRPTQSRRWSGWDQGLLEGLLVLVAIGAVVVAVLFGLDTATADHLEQPVDLRENVATIDPATVGGYRLKVDSATLLIEDPDAGQRIAAMIPMVVTTLVVGIASTLLWMIARSIRKGDPFHRSNARRLMWAAVVVLVGGMGASVADVFVSVSFADAAEGLPIDHAGTLSLLPLPIGVVLAALSEIFRRGAVLRDDVEGLV